MKKLFLSMIVFLLVLGLLACDGGNETAAEVSDLPVSRFEPDPNIPSWQLDYDHEVTLTWYVNMSWFQANEWAMDVITRKMQEDMNISIEFMSGGDENLNAMMASDDLPDIITIDRWQDVISEASLWALPLNVLAERYDPYFLAHATKPDIIAWQTQPNGNIYGFPNMSASVADFEAGYVWGDQAFIVRRDIYEAIGSPDMSTPDGFLNALRAAVKYMPETDYGVPIVAFSGDALDIIHGGTGSFGHILQDFLGIEPTVNGQFNDRDADPVYFEWLNVLRIAYSEGLIIGDQFSDDGSAIQERLSMGMIFAFMDPNVVGRSTSLAINNARNADQEYIVVPGPRHTDGRDHIFVGREISGWTNTFITTSATDPQAAIQVLTYLISPHGQIVNSFGIEGETFEWEGNVARLTPEWQEIRDTTPERFWREFGGFWMLTDEVFVNSLGNRPVQSIEAIIDWSSQYVTPRFQIENITPASGTTMLRNLNTIEVSRTLALVAVIEAETKEEARQIWDEFLDGRLEQGWEEIVAYKNERIADNLARLGW